MNLTLATLLTACGLALASAAAAAPAQRTLDLRLNVEATQDWRNDLQWGKSSTQQNYAVTVQLQSDGQMYAENLLNPDLARRLQIKNDWYLLQGLRELKAENGGKLPAPGAQPVLSAEAMMMGGMLSAEVANASPQRLTAQQALREKSAEELEAFMRKYDQPGGRWMYFEGFAGCANQLQIRYHSKFEGNVARKAGKSYPFDMAWDADTRGTPEQQQGLCRRYVASYEPATDTLFIENLFLPSPRGTSVRNEFGRTERKEVDLPQVYEVMRWADDALKQARGSGKLNTTLPITAALDGKDAALGSFTGTAKVTLEWSFR